MAQFWVLPKDMIVSKIHTSRERRINPFSHFRVTFQVANAGFTRMEVKQGSESSRKLEVKLASTMV